PTRRRWRAILRVDSECERLWRARARAAASCRAGCQLCGLGVPEETGLPPRLRSSFGALVQQPLDLCLERSDLGINLDDWARRSVLVEMSSQRDFVSDPRPAVVDPCVRYIRQYFLTHEVIDRGPVLQRRKALRRVF